jgi:hypothetical protein
MYGFRGMGDTLPAGVTTSPLQGAAPLTTVSPFALPACSWYQKVSGNGPFTCAFDPATALQNAVLFPGTYAEVLLPASVSTSLGTNAPFVLGAGVLIGAAWAAFKFFGGKR